MQGVLQQPTDSLQPVATFLGIPFATPPLGNLRFMPPVTVAPWKETLLANRFRPVCPQNIPDVSNTTSTGPRLSSGRAAEIRRSLRLLSSQSEDCLYLNVYTPASGEPPQPQADQAPITKYYSGVRPDTLHTDMFILWNPIWNLL